MTFALSRTLCPPPPWGQGHPVGGEGHQLPELTDELGAEDPEFPTLAGPELDGVDEFPFEELAASVFEGDSTSLVEVPASVLSHTGPLIDGTDESPVQFSSPIPMTLSDDAPSAKRHKVATDTRADGQT